MADSSFEKGLTELSKMKVADLKAELKQRGLPTTGNKTELVERLQLAIHDSSLSLDETTDEILDEDAVLGDEEIEDSEELVTKPDSQVEAEKRKLPAEENNTATKKIILNRKNIIEEVKVDAQKEKTSDDKKESEQSDKKVVKLSEISNNERLEMRAKKFGGTETAKKDVAKVTVTSNTTATNESKSTTLKTTSVGEEENKANDDDDDKAAEKKIIKLSELSTLERLEMRAKKFGVPLSDAAKKEARAARFNLSENTSTNNKSAASIKSAPVAASYEVLKKRGERFGTNVSSLMEKAELEAKKEQRKARFGEVKPLEKVAPTKIKLVK